MTDEHRPKTLGQAIDALIGALDGIDAPTRAVAIRTACEHFKIEGIVTPSASVPIASPLADSAGAAPPVGGNAILDIRTLTQTKNPATSMEMACVVGYYLQSVAPLEEHKDTLTSDDLDKYFRQANFPLPKRLDQLLVDGKAGGYFDSKGQGAYKLNAVGHNLVAHVLPRAEGAAVPRRRLLTKVGGKPKK